MIRLGVVNVYDPDTGWATHPVAAVAWTDEQPLRWEWVPLDYEARELRYLTLDELKPGQQVAWLERHLEEPTPTRAVELVDTLDAGLEGSVKDRVEALMDEIVVAGTR
jgi:hypothetical protein